MPDDQTRTRQANAENEPRQTEADAAGPSPLLEQAQAWANVAREAHQHCVQGDEAEQMLVRRRNASGE
jgi:hypothetical protein